MVDCRRDCHLLGVEGATKLLEALQLLLVRLCFEVFHLFGLLGLLQIIWILRVVQDALLDRRSLDLCRLLPDHVFRLLIITPK